MQRGLAARKLSVCPSVSLSDKRVICDKTKDSCALILISHKRTFILVFETKLVGGQGGDPFYLKFRVKVTTLERKRQFSIDICSLCLSHNN